MSYIPPEADIEFLMRRVFALTDEWQGIPALADFADDVLNAVVAEGGRVAAEVLSPLNRIADTEGCTWKDGEVTTPPGFKAAFAAFAEGGWLGLSGNPDYEGQGMPKT
jgi:alkylation response protein AidB-like acyl-CoA dehydrogenase